MVCAMRVAGPNSGATFGISDPDNIILCFTQHVTNPRQTAITNGPKFPNLVTQSGPYDCSWCDPSITRYGLSTSLQQTKLSHPTVPAQQGLSS